MRFWIGDCGFWIGYLSSKYLLFTLEIKDLIFYFQHLILDTKQIQNQKSKI